jgi:hypothetical protein
MKSIHRLAIALTVAATALIPGTSRAAFSCNPNQCFNLNCSQHVCPAGQIALPRCNLQFCSLACGCVSLPGGG